ncbi:hypothetical protein [Patulibacter defluvii]|uniref:hypothetical protein n=1 Tax=Patulibacter defluvii TaxID=3095358 RepID=UPI002A74AFE2|nr:hypothetical protein [Patulibacter sp. DM4]
MPWLVHTIGGLAIVALLGAAAWRLAGRTVRPEPLPRALATVVWLWLGVQLAGLATLLVPLGIAAVGGAAAVVLSGLVLWRVPRSAPPRPLALDERRLALPVAVAVAVLGWLMVHQPVLGYDGLLYHLGLPAAWEPRDALASLPHVVDGLPIEAYPIGFEVATGWLIAVTGATAVGTLLAPFSVGLLAVAVWTLTRRLGGGAGAAWGAVASVVLAIPALAGAGQVSNDLMAAALAATGVALVVDAIGPGWRADDERPPSLDGVLVGTVAALLAVGVKTTAASGVLVALVALWRLRRPLWAHLTAHRAWLLGLAAGLLVGGLWLARNLLLHGHPSWPLMASSFGDPVPPVIDQVDARFLDHPKALWELAGDRYLRYAWPLIPLTLLALWSVVRGRGAARVLGVCGLIGGAAWTVAPATGIASEPGLAVGAVRYLLPAWALLAAVGWSLLRDAGPRWRIAGTAAALATLTAQLWLGFDAVAADAPAIFVVPGEHALWGVCIAAAVLGLLLPWSPLAGLVLRTPLVAAVSAVLLVLLLTQVPGLWDRHARIVASAAAPVPAEPVLALGGTPAWSLGPYGRPGGRVVADCAAIERGFAAGRTVAIGPGLPPEQICALPGEPVVVDGFRVWVPGASR